MKHKTIFGLIMLIVFGALISGCESGPSGPIDTDFDIDVQPGSTEADDTGATSEGVNEMVEGSTNFAIDFYSQMKEGKGNIFFSPMSLSTAMAMAYEGAEGNTAQEIKDVFYFQEDDALRRASYARIHNMINMGKKDYKLHTANAMWTQPDYAFLEDYTGAIKDYYAGEAHVLDFKKSPEPSRQTINNWVEKKTNNLIKDLLPAGSVSPITRLVLTNAVYFKGDWAKQFKKSRTHEAEFTKADGTKVMVDMMASPHDDESFYYAETDTVQALELIYEGDELSMLILLPKNSTIAELEESLSAEMISGIRDLMFEMDVEVFLPKFKFDTSYGLNTVLADMGMPTAFTDYADFSGMNGFGELKITNVVHKAYVDVNEEGTEAAGATGITVGVTSAMPRYKTFRADHPFIFMIQERSTGGILFMGRVSDPSA